jgi:hypothetical protein
MAEFWNVQPYRYLYELRAEYTQSVTQATKNSAAIMAKEAEAWMKQNAPWKDRPDDPESGFKGGAARRGLKAYVVGSREEAGLKRIYQQNARAIDKMELQRMNAERKEKREKTGRRVNALLNSTRADDIDAYYWQKENEYRAQGRTMNYRKTMRLMREFYDKPEETDRRNRAEGRKLARKLDKQKQYKRRRAVPVGQSATKLFEKKWEGMRQPIVDVRFSHDEDLSYAIWLEIANGGRYNIIARATNHWAPKFFAKVKQISTLKQFRNKLAIRPEPASPETRFAQHVIDMNTGNAKYKERPYEAFDMEKHKAGLWRAKRYGAKAKATRAESQRLAEERAEVPVGNRRTTPYRPEVAKTMGINTVNRRR